MSDWLSHWLSREPKNQKELLEMLRGAKERDLLHADVLSMIEGAIRIAQLEASDIMVPKTQMLVINEESSLEQVLAEVIDSAHSRYPVVKKDNPDEILGILLAKDLLVFNSSEQRPSFSMTTLLRAPLIVPESKCLDSLLREFQAKHNHMAIVIDEYGSVAGLVTIEDILEEIVGEIEDEYDIEEEKQIIKKTDKLYVIDAQLSLDEFNEHFPRAIISEEFNTVAGVVMQAFGYVPKIGEKISLENYHFVVLQSDERKLDKLEVIVI